MRGDQPRRTPQKRVAECVSALQRISADIISADAPYAPMRLSRMISSFRSRVLPPPNPSATSDSPSSCRQPVISIAVPSASAAAAPGDRPAALATACTTLAATADHHADQRRGPDRLASLRSQNRSRQRQPREEDEAESDVVGDPARGHASARAIAWKNVPLTSPRRPPERPERIAQAVGDLRQRLVRAGLITCA